MAVGWCTRKMAMHDHAKVGARCAKWPLGGCVGCDRLGRMMGVDG